MTAAVKSPYRRCADVPCLCRSCSLGEADPRHGTTNGYGNLGCRCASCCRANTEAVRNYRLERRHRRHIQEVVEDMEGAARTAEKPALRVAFLGVVEALRQGDYCPASACPTCSLTTEFLPA